MHFPSPLAGRKSRFTEHLLRALGCGLSPGCPESPAPLFWSRYHYSHFTDEKTEALRDGVIQDGVCLSTLIICWMNGLPLSCSFSSPVDCVLVWCFCQTAFPCWDCPYVVESWAGHNPLWMSHYWKMQEVAGQGHAYALFILKQKSYLKDYDWLGNETSWGRNIWKLQLLTFPSGTSLGHRTDAILDCFVLLLLISGWNACQNISLRICDLLSKSTSEGQPPMSLCWLSLLHLVEWKITSRVLRNIVCSYAFQLKSNLCSSCDFASQKEKGTNNHLRQ